MDDRSVLTPDEPGPDDSVRVDAPTIEVPLAVAHVYNLEVISTSAGMEMPPPENPTVKQLKTNVTVRLPPEGGRLERIPNTRRVAFLERDRFGVPKRTVWVDKQGKVFAEVVEDEDDESTSRGNTIRLGLVRIFIDALVVVVVFILYVCVGSNWHLFHFSISQGDFIFYSILVAKAAQYSFTTFAACMLVILAGLGGTLVLLSVYHHALPALPISIFMGIVAYLMTRLVIQPWIESVMRTPYYV